MCGASLAGQHQETAWVKVFIGSGMPSYYGCLDVSNE
jgi:hypothetical protein